MRIAKDQKKLKFALLPVKFKRENDEAAAIIKPIVSQFFRRGIMERGLVVAVPPLPPLD